MTSVARGTATGGVAGAVGPPQAIAIVTLAATAKRVRTLRRTRDSCMGLTLPAAERHVLKRALKNSESPQPPVWTRRPPLECGDTVSVYTFGPFSLDTDRRRLMRGGEPLRVTPKAFETLLALI